MDKKDENLHSGHRERLRKSFLEKGFTENTPIHEMLELLLFYSIPRKNTNELAHRLINHFGSISAVLDASIDELTKVAGMGESSAILIKMIMPIARAYLDDKGKHKNRSFKSMDDICNTIIKKYVGVTEEIFAVTTFSSLGVMLGFDVISNGDISTVEIPLRKIVEVVISKRASCVIISHNHPDGNALPSMADISSTIKIKELLENINVKLLDHIIVASDDCISFAQSKEYRHILGYD